MRRTLPLVPLLSIASLFLFAPASAAPDIAVSPTSLTQELVSGETANQALTIGNSGDADLHFLIGIDNAFPARALQRRERHAALGGASHPSPGATVTRSASASVPFVTDRAPRSKPLDADEIKISNLQVGGDVRLLFLVSGADVSQIQELLLAFPDISVVDVYGAAAVPELTYLLDYDAVIVMTNFPFADPVGVGDVLADYMDAGGGVILTLASFISGWEIQGRFISGGYSPFEVGPSMTGPSSLGTFDPDHPIMEGVTSLHGFLIGATTVAPGADLVASWSNGQPCVATKLPNVVGVNVFIGDSGYWGGQVPLLLHNAAFWMTGGFLHVYPVSGVVPAGGTLDLTAMFDARGFLTGTYQASVLVSSDDPDEPTVTVPATLSVIGVPDIFVVPLDINFGTVIVGTTATWWVTVSNAGTDVLVVTDASTDHPDYAVDVSSFSVNPGASQTLVATFSPSSPGVSTASLTITNNDPDEPSVVVPLTGLGNQVPVPPTISVTPSSLEEDLITGETSTQTLTINNSGDEDLVWSAFAVPSAAAPAPQSAYGRGESQGSARSENEQPSAGPATLLGPYVGDYLRFDVSGYGEIMPFQHPLGNEHLQYIYPIRSGYTVSYLTNGVPITKYAAFGIRSGIVPVWFNELENSPTRVMVEVVTRTSDGTMEIQRIFTFERSERFVRIDTRLRNISASVTGAVIFKDFADWDVDRDSPDDDWQWDSTRNLIVASDATFTGLASREPPTLHDITGWNDYQVRTTTVDRPDSATNLDGLALLDFQLGDLSPGRDASLQTVFAAGNDLDQLHEAVARGIELPWLSVEPISGVIAAGSSANLSVTFAPPPGLVSGTYHGDVVVSCNDPVSPELIVPATLHMTGVQGVVVSPQTLDFALTFIGASATKSVTVSNTGADVLVVTDVSTNHADYTVDASSFSLDPAESRSLVVTYSPSSPGVSTASLTVTSNDPDDPSVVVALSGEGIEPPVISVTPSSLEEDLFNGETSTQTLTIANNGVADLEWSALVALSAPAPASQSAYGRRDSEGPSNHSADDQASGGPVTLSGVYIGDFVRFGVSAYGEIMPFQHPVGSEHLQLGTFISGYTVSYLTNGVPITKIAAFSSRSGIVPVSYIELENSPTRVVVEVVTRTSDGAMEIMRTLMFARSQRFVRIDTRLRNISAVVTGAVIFKDFADWDVDGDTLDDDWQWDPLRNLIVASDATFTGLASRETPVLHDIEGWNDYLVRTTSVDIPNSATNYDGLALLHFEPGDLSPGQEVTYQTVFAAGNDLDQLHEAVARGIEPQWLSVAPISGAIAGGSSANLSAMFDPTGLPGGTYHGDVVVSCNDLVTPEVTVPVTLHVTGAPVVSVAPAVLDFGNVSVGGSSALPLEVKNIGTEVLTVTNITVSDLDYVAIPTTFQLPPLASQTVQLTFAPSSAGPHPASLTLEHNAPSGTTSVPLTGTGQTASSGPDVATLPTTYMLYQNSPNPFRVSAATQIAFDLPRSSRVELKIFDVAGRLVQVLVDHRSLPAGKHAARWDGTDSAEHRTAAGVYFYQLNAGEFQATRRMIRLQ